MARPEFDPKGRVDLTRVQKQGDWYHVEGVADGRRGSVDIPASHIDGNSRSIAEARLKRGVLGTVLQDGGA